MKLTQEFKEALITLYWGKRVIKIKELSNGDYDNKLFTPFEYLLQARDYPYEIEYIQLKPIESITDEQAKEFGADDREDFFFEIGIEGTNTYADKLREMGFAVAFRNVLVQTMIKDGILKLEK
jgi:hypothetical protein